MHEFLIGDALGLSLLVEPSRSLHWLCVCLLVWVHVDCEVQSALVCATKLFHGNYTRDCISNAHGCVSGRDGNTVCWRCPKGTTRENFGNGRPEQWRTEVILCMTFFWAR